MTARCKIVVFIIRLKSIRLYNRISCFVSQVLCDLHVTADHVEYTYVPIVLLPTMK